MSTKLTNGVAPAGRDAPASMLVPLVVACAFFMENFDGTVVTTALPDIAVSFGVSPVSASTGVTAYLVGLAVFIPVSGWMADRFGARSIFRAAMAIYAVASICCAFSSTLLEFVAARTMQGFAGALMVPVGRLIVLRTFERRHFVQAMAFVTTPALVGGVLGPPIGGFLATFASWRWIFAINVAMGLVGIILVSLLFKPDKPIERRPMDWPGFLLGGSAVAAFVFGFDLLAREAASLSAAGLIVAAGLALGSACVWHSSRAAHPLIDLGLLRFPTFASSAGAGSIFNAAAAAVSFLVPILFQVGFGMTAWESGLVTLALAVGAFAMKAMTPRVLARFGFRTTLFANGLIGAIAIFACLSFSPATPLLLMAAVLLVFGFARSLQIAALNAISYADVPDAKTSAATSLASTLRQTSNGLGVAISAVIMQTLLSAHGGDLQAFDVQAALGFAGLAATVSALLFLRLDPAAGASVSRHRSADRGPGTR